MLSFVQPAALRSLPARARHFPFAHQTASIRCASTPARTQAPIPPVPLLHTLRHGRALVRETLTDALQRCKSRVAIDATCGRGSDTLTLGLLLGAEGHVHAIDVQEAAVVETRARYAECDATSEMRLATLSTYCTSHADFHVLGLEDDCVAAVVYNLGWYPAANADRTVITVPASTIPSLEEARRVLALHGVVVVTAYPGHPGGREEADAVREWIQGLDPRVWNCMAVEYPNRDAAPIVYVCERVK